MTEEPIKPLPGPPPMPQEDHDLGDLNEYLQIIIDYRWIIMAATVAALICSTIYYSLQPNYYSAQAKILVERVDSQPRSRQELVMPTGQPDDEAYYGTQIEILTGRRISAQVEKELGEMPAGYSLDAQQLRGTHIIALNVTSGDPQVAAKVANKFAEVYVRESSKEGLFVTQQMLKLLPDQTDLQGQNPSAATDAAVPAATPSSFDKNQYAESLMDVSEDMAIQQMKSEKLELEAKYRELSQRYKESHPAIIEMKEKLQFYDTQLKERMGKILTNVRANLSGEIAITNVKVLEEADVPGGPAGPNRPFDIFLATMVGFLVTSVGIILYEVVFQRVRTIRDIYSGVGIPFLGYIPLFNGPLRRQKMFMPAAPDEDRPTLIELMKKNSIVTDSVVSVRTHILFTVSYENSKRIMITSAVPGEGKTTVSTLLALSLTALKRKIIFIDADMRRPTSHNYLGIRNEKGLSDYLSNPQLELSDIVRTVEGSELKTITAGSRISNPAELLASERFRDMLERLGAEYDRIVIDAPPVLYIPDALIVAKYVHTGILICGAGMVQKKIVRSVKEKFDSIHHSLIGVVINRADYEGQRYRYNYYHSYKSYYSKRKTE